MHRKDNLGFQLLTDFGGDFGVYCPSPPTGINQDINFADFGYFLFAQFMS